METLNIIIFFCGILIIIIFFNWNKIYPIFKKNTDNKVLQKDGSSSKSKPDAGNTNPPPAGHTTNKKTNFLSIVGWVIGSIIVLAIIIWLVGAAFKAIEYISNFFKPDTYSWVTTKSRIVPINGEYGNIYYYTNPNEGISFENATVDFCVHNEVREKCGVKGKTLKEISNSFPGTDQNLNFQIKASNTNDSGFITVKYWKKVKDKK